jgi:adenylate kinase
LVQGTNLQKISNNLKLGWIGLQESLPCFVDGKNFVPMIHVRDLANIVYKIVDEPPTTEEEGDTSGTGQYIFGVDESQVTLLDIVKAVSKEFLGTEKVHNLPPNECLLHENADYFMADLKLQLGIVETFADLPWHSKEGIVERIKDIRKEYEKRRNLSPLKLCILGAPASGKSLFAAKLAKQYKTAHVKMQDVIKEFFNEVCASFIFVTFCSELC